VSPPEGESDKGARISIRKGLPIILCALGFAALALYFAIQISKKPHHQLRMGTTSTRRLRALAFRIAREGERSGLDIEVSREEHSAEEALELVDGRALDFALVPGGVEAKGLGNVRQVAALDMDPLHLLVKQEFFPEVSRGLGALKGRSVNLNVAGGIAHALGEGLLKFAKLTPPDGRGAGDFTPVYLSDEEMIDRLDAIAQRPAGERSPLVAALPDAAFTVSPLPSVAAERLVTVAGYRLVSLPLADAFALALNRSRELSEAHARTPHLYSALIPAFLYNTDPPVPATPCQTIGVRLVVVAHRDTDSKAVAELLKIMNEAPLVGLLQPSKVDEQTAEFELHPGTLQYMRRNDPVLTPQLLAHLGSALGGVGAFTGGMVALYGLWRLLRLRKVESYYQELRRIELVARGAEVDPDAPLDPAERIAYLEGRLTEIKCRALEDFATGDLRGEGALQGIVALVNDTRNSLGRLLSCQGQQQRSSADLGAL
jgi:TRAP-type uncharacterized transport system substrate-binding protein